MRFINDVYKRGIIKCCFCGKDYQKGQRRIKATWLFAKILFPNYLKVITSNSYYGGLDCHYECFLAVLQFQFPEIKNDFKDLMETIKNNLIIEKL